MTESSVSQPPKPERAVDLAAVNAGTVPPGQIIDDTTRRSRDW